MRLPRSPSARSAARLSGQLRAMLKPDPNRGTDRWQKGLIEWTADSWRGVAYDLARPWWWLL